LFPSKIVPYKTEYPFDFFNDLEKIESTIKRASFPDVLITAIPPTPGGLEIAQTVSLGRENLFIL
jgi:hypothetical protein